MSSKCKIAGKLGSDMSESVYATHKGVIGGEWKHDHLAQLHQYHSYASFSLDS